MVVYLPGVVIPPEDTWETGGAFVRIAWRVKLWPAWDRTSIRVRRNARDHVQDSISADDLLYDPVSVFWTETTAHVIRPAHAPRRPPTRMAATTTKSSGVRRRLDVGAASEDAGPTSNLLLTLSADIRYCSKPYNSISSLLRNAQ